MIKVVIIGAGNVATHLYSAFSEAKQVEVLQVYNRNPEHLTFVKPEKRISALKDLKKADLYILAVSDGAVEEIVSEIPIFNAIYVHTSGSVPMSSLDKFQNFGVFYPLQTFSKEKKVNYREVPLCLEANSSKNLKFLEEVGQHISDKVYEIDSSQRKSLHLAAVFVNNFSNHLFALAAEFCNENEVPFEILQPLIKETLAKLDSLSPYNAQTGPAIRNDEKTIQGHLEMLDENGKEIYKTLTQSIQNLYGKKL